MRRDLPKRRIARIFLVLCAYGALLGVGPASAPAAEMPTPAIFVVATNGNDAWSGMLTGPNAAKTDGPFATLEQARDAVRALKKAGPLPAGGVEVRMRQGTYELTNTLAFTETDSGTEVSPVVYRNFGSEKVVLTGGKRITGFKPYKGAILQADVGGQGFKGVYFRQLFFNGKRQPLARYPNFDPANPYAGGYAYVDGVPVSMYQDLTNDTKRVIRCRPRDARSWTHPEEGEVNIFPRYNWGNSMVPIASADKEKGTITLAQNITEAIRPLDRYYVRNLFEELDSPGEWYLDKRTWTLFFWPPGPIANAEVCAPVVDNLIQFNSKASWTTIRGFTLECCEGNAVLLTGAENCLIAANTIHNTGGRLELSAGVYVNGGHSCKVVGNDVFEVCNYGIVLRGGDVKTLTPGGHLAENNYVHHIGVLNGHGCGFFLGGVGLRVAHNLVHDTTRCGIFGGGNDTVIEYNHIRHVNLETEDTGGYYYGGEWQERGKVIRYNYIHDVLGYGRDGNKWISPYNSWGIYLDDAQSGTQVYGNIIARAGRSGVFIHAGRDNVVENNILVEGPEAQMMYTDNSPNSGVVAMYLGPLKEFQTNRAYAKYPELTNTPPDKMWQMAGNKFRRNIISYRSPKAKLYQYSYEAAHGVPEQNECDYNLIWHFGLLLTVGLPGLKPETSWPDWRQRGFDTHSLIADPLFVDAEKDDYRLKPGSPAFELGFQPIPVEKIGPYQDPLRATWPIVEAAGVREHPIPAQTLVEMAFSENRGK